MPSQYGTAVGAVLALLLLPALLSCDFIRPAGPTVGQLAEKGVAVFAARCGNCHGVKGEGAVCPPVIGDNTDLAKYKTAGELLTYLSAAMPFDAPGSLSNEEYSQVLSYLLLQNHFAAGKTALTPHSMSTIRLEK